CSYANIVVRKDLWDKGVTSVAALADGTRVGRKAVVAATAIGSGTYVYGVYVLKGIKGADGRPVHESVDWVGGGASTTMLGGLKAGKFDAIMAVPEWQWAAEDEGFGKAIYDVQDPEAWTRVFGGDIPVTVGYALKETVERSPGVVQAYVNATYRAQQWLRRARDEEIVELLHKPYMDTFKREVVLRSVTYYKTIFDWDLLVEPRDYANGMKVWLPIAVEKPIPFAQAADMSFVKKAQTKFTS
ncbi:MAG: ABC transporter substrate-binding protein, partial [Candidatus Rokuibacteriota bacterium]